MSGQRDNLIDEIGTSIMQCRGSRVPHSTEAFRSASAGFRPGLRSLEQNNMRAFDKAWSLIPSMAAVVRLLDSTKDTRLQLVYQRSPRLPRCAYSAYFRCLFTLYSDGSSQKCTHSPYFQLALPVQTTCWGTSEGIPVMGDVGIRSACLRLWSTGRQESRHEPFQVGTNLHQHERDRLLTIREE